MQTCWWSEPGPGEPATSACSLVGEADPEFRAGPLVVETGSWGLWLQGPWGPEVGLSDYW